MFTAKIESKSVPMNQMVENIKKLTAARNAAVVKTETTTNNEEGNQPLVCPNSNIPVSVHRDVFPSQTRTKETPFGTKTPQNGMY